jgi:hypothetical protein
MNDTLKNLDIIIKQYGIKYVFVESGRLSVEQKCNELNINPNDYPTAMFWCELSWDDFAYNSFGNTLGEAIQNCLNNFSDYIF